MRRSPLSGWKWIACFLIAAVTMQIARDAFSAPAKHGTTRIGILVVGSKQDAATVTQGGALMAQLYAMRERKGYSNQRLGLLVLDYASSMEVAATAARFGITQKDLVFTGVVRVGPDNRPIAVLSRHTRVQDVSAVAQAVFAEAESAMGVAPKTSSSHATTSTPTSYPGQPSPSTQANPAPGTAAVSATLPASPAIPPKDIRVNADGSGDFPYLEQALQAAPEGATLHLGAGTFKLDRGLIVTKSIRLQGEGMNVTTVVCDSPSYFCCIEVKGNVNFAANGIAFEAQGTAESNVATFTGTIDVRACRFRGARAVSKLNGNGLAIVGSAQGTVSDCECTQNQRSGMILLDHAAVNLMSNRCQDNQFGMTIKSDGNCNIRANTCSGNRFGGIGVTEHGTPTLEDNRCTENFGDGMLVMGASPSLLNNICSSNADYGIEITQDSAPTVEGNVCNDNKRAGISIYAPARGIIRNNTCTNNQIAGIFVARGAQPILQDNTATGNAQGNILRQ